MKYCDKVLIQSATAFLLQSATTCYYKVRQLVITMCDSLSQDLINLNNLNSFKRFYKLSLLEQQSLFYMIFIHILVVFH